MNTKTLFRILGITVANVIKRKMAKMFAVLGTLLVISGCASMGPASQSLSIGMSKQDVISIVGSGNVTLAKKRTQTTANGVAEVWILYKGPFGWGWAGNSMDKQVVVTFENGTLNSITE